MKAACRGTGGQHALQIQKQDLRISSGKRCPVKGCLRNTGIGFTEQVPRAESGQKRFLSPVAFLTMCTLPFRISPICEIRSPHRKMEASFLYWRILPDRQSSMAVSSSSVIPLNNGECFNSFTGNSLINVRILSYLLYLQQNDFFNYSILSMKRQEQRRNCNGKKTGSDR